MTDRLPKTSLFDFGGSFFPSDSLDVFFDTEADALEVRAEINSLLPDAACEIFSLKKIDEWASDSLENAGFVASRGGEASRNGTSGEVVNHRLCAFGRGHRNRHVSRSREAILPSQHVQHGHC
jgi:hypothetical protein